jgi:hypothetical protein
MPRILTLASHLRQVEEIFSGLQEVAGWRCCWQPLWQETADPPDNLPLACALLGIMLHIIHVSYARLVFELSSCSVCGTGNLAAVQRVTGD